MPPVFPRVAPAAQPSARPAAHVGPQSSLLPVRSPVQVSTQGRRSMNGRVFSSPVEDSHDPHKRVEDRQSRPGWPRPCQSAPPKTACSPSSMLHRIVGSNFNTMSRETTSHPAPQGSANRLCAAKQLQQSWHVWNGITQLRDGKVTTTQSDPVKQMEPLEMPRSESSRSRRYSKKGVDAVLVICPCDWDTCSSKERRLVVP